MPTSNGRDDSFLSAGLPFKFWVRDFTVCKVRPSVDALMLMGRKGHRSSETARSAK